MRARARRYRIRSPRAYTSGELAVIKELQNRGIIFFTQQKIRIGGKTFIIDIFVPPNLAVEIDGIYHVKDIRISRDQVKDEALRSIGVKVLRFSDAVAKSRPSKVVDEVLKELKSISSQED
ncbi:MAG: endonuclease domain-containing protein [Candidatus Nezhaarchaeota archaeon]|nr:endonuclease domain-containing protein [Candidatus Nezhaarchaeota archaeon]MCX8141399.1 endonuclease domain-containing protein [Candidatus Nezhaarchaeota archaeon]MDW8049665.1 DUF559 domain-containing protein [Nitrososphaerota archaeon]